MDLTSLCADYYKRETLIDAYSVPIMPVGHPGSWVVPADIASRVVLNPKAKRQSGRLMEGRYASSSERTTTQSCRRCGQHDIIAGGVPTRLWLMKVPAQLSQRNTAVSAASVIKLDTTNKRALRRTVPWNEWSLDDPNTFGNRIHRMLKLGLSIEDDAV